MTLTQKARARRIDCLKSVAEGDRTPRPNKRFKQVVVHLFQPRGGQGLDIGRQFDWAS